MPNTRSIDAKDLQIILALQEDGRLSNLDLAKRVNLSPSPCLRRVRILEDAGIIRGYSAEIDPRAIGFNVTAFIRISLSKHDADIVAIFERRVHEIDAIMDCYLLTGEADYLLRVMVPDLESYEVFVRQWLHPIPGINSITTSFVYGTVKATRILPIK